MSKDSAHHFLDLLEDWKSNAPDGPAIRTAMGCLNTLLVQGRFDEVDALLLTASSAVFAASSDVSRIQMGFLSVTLAGYRKLKNRGTLLAAARETLSLDCDEAQVEQILSGLDR